jgi:hypothetical protein
LKAHRQAVSRGTHTEKSTKKSTAKLTGDVYYQVDQDPPKHRRYWNQPPPEDFHRGRRIRRRKITGKDHGRRYGKTNTSVTNQTLHRDDYQEVDRDSLKAAYPVQPKTVDRKVTDTYSEPHY